MSDKKWIVGFILVCVLLVLGFIIGNEDLKIKMASAGLIALVTGIPMYFISLAKESKKTDTPEIEQTPIYTSEASMVDNHLANTLKETASKNSPPNVIPADDLWELKKAFDKGLITEEEFSKKKRQLLDI